MPPVGRVTAGTGPGVRRMRSAVLNAIDGKLFGEPDAKDCEASLSDCPS